MAWSGAWSLCLLACLLTAGSPLLRNFPRFSQNHSSKPSFFSSLLAPELKSYLIYKVYFHRFFQHLKYSPELSKAELKLIQGVPTSFDLNVTNMHDAERQSRDGPRDRIVLEHSWNTGNVFELGIHFYWDTLYPIDGICYTRRFSLTLNWKGRAMRVAAQSARIAFPILQRSPVNRSLKFLIFFRPLSRKLRKGDPMVPKAKVHHPSNLLNEWPGRAEAR